MNIPVEVKIKNDKVRGLHFRLQIFEEMEAVHTENRLFLRLISYPQ